MRISDWSSDVCSSDLEEVDPRASGRGTGGPRRSQLAGRWARRTSARRDAAAAVQALWRVEAARPAAGLARRNAGSDREGAGRVRVAADTNVVVRYLTGDDAQPAGYARSAENTSELQS